LQGAGGDQGEGEVRLAPSAGVLTALREKREKKQAEWEERRQAREERLAREGKAPGEGERRQQPVRRDDEWSSSEEEGWCGGVPGYRGTEAVERDVAAGEAGGEMVEEAGEEMVEEGDVVQEAVREDGAVEGGDIESGPEEDIPEEVVRDLDDAGDVKLEEDPEEINIVENCVEDIHEDKIAAIEASGDVKGDSSDEAPEEIKTVKSRENDDTPEDHSIAAASTSEDKSRKYKKRKRKVINTEADVEDVKEAKTARVEAAKARVTRPSVLQQRIRPPTLLERLLLADIRQERNTVLQCVRFVCKNNFFDTNDDGSQPKST
jgi:hypothetical protein